jgi:hypothetical protein
MDGDGHIGYVAESDELPMTAKHLDELPPEGKFWMAIRRRMEEVLETFPWNRLHGMNGDEVTEFVAELGAEAFGDAHVEASFYIV